MSLKIIVTEQALGDLRTVDRVDRVFSQRMINALKHVAETGQAPVGLGSLMKLRTREDRSQWLLRMGSLYSRFTIDNHELSLIVLRVDFRSPEAR